MRRVWGFCDDWEASIVGIRPVREIKTLVNEFEAASGQEVNKRKTTWLPNRAMSATERRALREHWPGAVVVDRQRVLGTPLGHGVTTTDFAASALEEFQHRIIAFSSSRLSFAMRVLAVNTFLYPLFSYVTRILILPVDVQNHIVNSAMRFVSRVPFCRATVLIHAKTLFGIPFALQNFALDNFAGVIATAKRLEARGTLCADMLQAWRAESPSDGDTRNIYNAPRPLTHIAIAYDSFRLITGSTADDFLRRRSQRQNVRRTQRSRAQHAPYHMWLYEEMLRSDREHAVDYLRARLRDRGMDWTLVQDNLRRLPRAVPQAHRITLMRFLLNGLATTRRLRQALGIETRNCPFCGEVGADDIEHWSMCIELRDCMRAIFSTQLSERIFHNEACHLQMLMQGTDLQHVCAILHAIWRCRCTIVAGYKLWSRTDMAYHMQSLIDDPWIVGAPHDLTRQERRTTRMQIPEMCPGWAVYNSDGASRTSSEGDRLASSGALLTIDGAIVARHGQHLGDMTIPKRNILRSCTLSHMRSGIIIGLSGSALIVCSCAISSMVGGRVELRTCNHSTRWA